MNLYDYLPASTILDNKIFKLAYARDASIYRLIPDAIVRPRSIQEIKKLLSYARQSKTPITFRTSGTSLSGQSITHGVIAETVYDWSKLKILEQGDFIRMQPGVNGSFANKILLPYNRRIGPDPASINVARIGGIVSNNASGMACGTEYNSYHTLHNISFVLANGHDYNTSAKNENSRFFNNEPDLAKGLLKIRENILNQPKLVQKIREKYRLKNTIGYSMNSFLDYKNPIDIFSHLLVGSEGTLAFISEVTLKTIPDPPEKGTGLLFFKSPEAAGNSVSFFKNLGSSVVEILDDQSLRTAKYLRNPPYDPNQIPDDFTALLIEFQENDYNDISRLVKDVKLYVSTNKNIHDSLFVTGEKDRNMIWKIRKSLYPTVGSLRTSGTSVITEDIAVDIDNLPVAIRRLRKIFKKRKFYDSVIFGHAKDGNLHFVTSIDLTNPQGEKNYEGMMNDLSKMTIGEFDGSLKAEHGTGRNMAPFVETEWGSPIFEIMWQIKRLSDPNNILNPDVLLSRDQKIHLKNLKTLPKIHDEVDTCVECGFCERVCPSSGLTLTPRQRIGVMRELKINNLLSSELNNFQYSIEKTCATDGLCSEVCPVNIDTGKMVKSLRSLNDKDPRLVKVVSNNFHFVVKILYRIFAIANLTGKIFGNSLLHYFTESLNKHISRNIPIWPLHGIARAKPLQFPKKGNDHFDFVHFPSCVNRLFSTNISRESSSMLLHKISDMAEKEISVFKQYEDYCCGMAFDSRGFTETGRRLRKKLLQKLFLHSKKGQIPIIIDLSPCTQYILEGNTKNLQIIDSVTFLNNLKESLILSPIQSTVYAHSVCSYQKMNNEKVLFDLVKSCAVSVETSMEGFCCGMAGDRGLRIPELARHSIQKSTDINAELGVSSSRTCELSLKENTGIEFISIEELILRAISNST
ncbi:MAG: hypothetical protein CMG74_08200 [Candidatus Marinimicrobia bacterium]|nr:hypothetical protein [Candidatus Neomarinimicrobiota bacterium]